MNPLPRILFFENTPAYFLSHRLSLARELEKLGYAVHVAAIPDAAAETIRSTGFEFHPLPYARSSMNPFKEWRALREIRRLYDHLRPVLVYQVNSKPVIYGTIAARRERLSAVVSVISGLGYAAALEGFRGKLLLKLVFALYRFALRHPHQKVIFHNRDDRDRFVQRKILSELDTEVLPGSGVDVEHFVPTPEPVGTPLVVLPARMLFDKGVSEFVAAAELLRAEGVQARFLLAGDTDRGNSAAVDEARLQRWRVEGNVEWLGHVQDMRALYASCHIVCLPSYREAMPAVLLEAASSGRCVVATDVPGCRDVVSPGETGLLVPPHNAGKLAVALRSLIENPELRQCMGYRARGVAENYFAIPQVVARTIHNIQELMAVSG